MQTLIKLFYTCPAVKTFWKVISNWLREIKIFSFPLSLTDICFGVETSNKIIYAFVMYGKHLFFRLDIIYFEKVERVIATRQGQMLKHTLKNSKT